MILKNKIRAPLLYGVVALVVLTTGLGATLILVRTRQVQPKAVVECSAVGTCYPSTWICSGGYWDDLATGCGSATGQRCRVGGVCYSYCIPYTCKGCMGGRSSVCNGAGDNIDSFSCPSGYHCDANAACRTGYAQCVEDNPAATPTPTQPAGCIGDPACPGNTCVGNTCTDCSGTIRGGTFDCSGGTPTPTPCSILPHPTKLSPSGTLSCTSTSVRLDWQPVSGARDYWVALDEVNGTGNPSCGGPYDWCWGPSADYQDVTIASGKNYNWTVTTWNTCGVNSDYGGNWSSSMSFNTVCPSPTPTVTVTPTTTPTPTPTFSPTPSPTLTPTPTPTPTPTTIVRLKVKFQGVFVQRPDKTVKIALRQTGQTDRVFNIVMQSDASGVYSYTGSEITVPVGVYDVLVKGPVHMQKKFAGVNLSAGGVVTKDFSGTVLRAGDISGFPYSFPFDNTISALDYNILAGAFEVGVYKSSVADLNFDGTVSTLDYNLLAGNFNVGVYGDQ